MQLLHGCKAAASEQGGCGRQPYGAAPGGALTPPRFRAAFLNQKSWHPLSYRNQKALFEAEAAAAARRDADAKAKEEFEAEQEFFRRAPAAAAARRDVFAGC